MKIRITHGALAACAAMGLTFSPGSAQELPSGFSERWSPAAAPVEGLDEVPQAERRVPLADLIDLARERSPEIQAAQNLATAAEARIPQAGALPDPTFSAGLMYLPIPDFDLSAEGMTMFSFEISQRIPTWGSRGIREDAARSFHEAELRQVDEIELQVVSRLKVAYHELTFVHAADAVLRRNRALLNDFAGVARGRLAVGDTPQQDVLRAQTEVTRVDEQLAGLEDRRIAALTEINQILNRDPLEPIVPEYPEALHRAATARPTQGAFTAAALESGLGPELPSLEELQAAALGSRPALVAHVRRIEGMRHRRDLAIRERRPDLGWMAAYSPRSGRRDMLSFGISVDLPVFRSRKQDQAVAEAEALLAEHESRHHEMVAALRSEVTRHYSALVRTRERIVLLAEGVLPQARATVESASGAYQAGRIEFTGLLEAQATLFRNEIELERLMADFGREWAELEAVVGTQLEPGNQAGPSSTDANDEEMNR